MVDESKLDDEDLAFHWEFLEGWHFGYSSWATPVDPTLEEYLRLDEYARELDVLAAEHCREHGIMQPRTAEEIYGGPLPCIQSYEPDYYVEWDREQATRVWD